MRFKPTRAFNDQFSVMDHLRLHGSTEEWDELAKLPEFVRQVEKDCGWLWGDLNLWQRENGWWVVEKMATQSRAFSAETEELHAHAKDCPICSQQASSLHEACMQLSQMLCDLNSAWGTGRDLTDGATTKAEDPPRSFYSCCTRSSRMQPLPSWSLEMRG